MLLDQKLVDAIDQSLQIEGLRQMVTEAGFPTMLDIFLRPEAAQGDGRNIANGLELGQQVIPAFIWQSNIADDQIYLVLASDRQGFAGSSRNEDVITAAL